MFEIIDTNPHPDAIEKFQNMTRAYNCLSDETARLRYDTLGEDDFNSPRVKETDDYEPPGSDKQLKENNEVDFRLEHTQSRKQIFDLDLYEVLGVSRDSDEETVKKAYKMLARIYHPGKLAQILSPYWLLVVILLT